MKIYNHKFHWIIDATLETLETIINFPFENHKGLSWWINACGVFLSYVHMHNNAIDLNKNINRICLHEEQGCDQV